MKVGDRISEQGRLGTVDSFHTPGTVDVKFDDMDYAIRRQMPNIVALKSNPAGSGCLTMRYNGRKDRNNTMTKKERRGKRRALTKRARERMIHTFATRYGITPRQLEDELEGGFGRREVKTEDELRRTLESLLAHGPGQRAYRARSRREPLRSRSRQSGQGRSTVMRPRYGWRSDVEENPRHYRDPSEIAGSLPISELPIDAEGKPFWIDVFDVRHPVVKYIWTHEGQNPGEFTMSFGIPGRSPVGISTQWGNQLASYEDAVEAEKKLERGENWHDVARYFHLRDHGHYPNPTKKNPRGNDMAIIYRQNRSSRKLTMAQRERLPLSDFVFPDRAPGVGAYPINDLYHAKKALTMASWSKKGKREMPYILKAVLRKYPQLEDWDKINRYYDIAEDAHHGVYDKRKKKVEDWSDPFGGRLGLPQPPAHWSGQEVDLAANPSKLEELKDRRLELMRIPAPGWGWMGPYAPWEKIQKDIKELSRQIEAEERRLEKKNPRRRPPPDPDDHGYWEEEWMQEGYDPGPPLRNPYEVGYPMRENWEWSDLAFWKKKGFQEGSAKAWEGTRKASAAAWKGTKKAGSALYDVGQKAASEAAYQAELLRAKGAVNGANGRIKSLKSCAKELEVSDSMLEGTKSMQTARSSLSKAKKKVENVKADRQEALAARKGGGSQKQLPVAANPYRKRRNTGKNDFTIYHADHGIKPAQLKHIKTKLAQLMPEGFSIQAIKIPKKLGSVPNAMYGPAAGDRPVLESEVYYDKRGDRDVLDRMTSRPVRPWSEVQAIGIKEGNKFTIFTIYGGPLAPQHPDDPNNRDVEGSRRFWSQHALSDQQWKGNPRSFGAHGGRHNPGGKKALRAQYRKKHGPKWHANPSVKRKFEKEWKSR